MGLKPKLVESSKKIEAVLHVFFNEQENICASIHPSLGNSIQLLQEFSLRGGKSVRSFLSLTSAQLAGLSQTPDIYKAAACVELHHKHILILDDIADRDETRYGGPTVQHSYYQTFGSDPEGMHRSLSFAMLDGVLLGALSKELLLSTSFPSKVILKAIHLLNTIMYRDTLAGWQIHGLQAILPIQQSTEEEFIKGLRLVTARYTFTGPLLFGLTLAESNNPTLEHAIREYGENVGTAFQIQDDILGVFGDPAITGKPVGNDIREGKKTLLLQHAYRHSNSADQHYLEKCIGKPLMDQELIRIQRIIKDSGSLEHSNEIAKEYVNRGIRALQDLPESDPKETLIELAHYIIERNK